MPTNSKPLIRIIAQIVAIWIASDIGYYVLLPLLGFPANYNLSPSAITFYYLFWVVFTVNTFWDIFRDWKPIKSDFSVYIFLIASFAAMTLFVMYALPNLPSVTWTETWDPPELMVANAWYFLPKSVEILLQQLLIAALVLALSVRNFSVREISYWCVLIFGGAHLLLALDGHPLTYVVRFTISAMIFGYIFPNLILRARNGFVYSYALHWLYYAVTIIMMHTISPYAS